MLFGNRLTLPSNNAALKEVDPRRPRPFGKYPCGVGANGTSSGLVHGTSRVASTTAMVLLVPSVIWGRVRVSAWCGPWFGANVWINGARWSPEKTW